MLVTIGEHTHLAERDKIRSIILSQLLNEKYYWQTVLFLIHSYDETINDVEYYELIKVSYFLGLILFNAFFKYTIFTYS